MRKLPGQPPSEPYLRRRDRVRMAVSMLGVVVLFALVCAFSLMSASPR